ncbi:lysosomal acid lipase/cholesteryl ester hydrolase [Ixodes scapularis]|uniref:lysosomal acid lipase/cholesteryl ester hydrolase n=1 Tax=Ixodes scapularis TaxID=6945 RepID=UPI001C38F487|nr:lysosomal acid lipase/cholesteryl ester hydrolase [Ixodes scapularis]
MTSSVLAQLIPGLVLTSVRAAVNVTTSFTGIGYDDSKLCTDISGLIKGEGYPFERHDVVTRDGYIIEMHRIPRGRAPCPEPCKREPIFVMTGLLADSASFVLDFPKQSLGYVLADNKYDVWLGNTRGNTYGKRHKRYSPKSRRFWNFSFHEHAKYDAPAQIDYILNVTNRKSLLYVGLSQGTLMFFTMMSEKPEYNDKVKAFAGLAPFNKLAHMIVPPLELAAPFAESFLRAVNAAGQYEVLAQGSPFMPIARRFCSLITSRIVCSLIGDTLTNYGSRYINETRTPLYLCHVPAGTSMKNIIHFDQLVKSKKPQKFDYGEEINQEYYGQRRPPLYKLANVKTDVGIFWSKGDEFVPPENVKILIKELGPRVKKNHYIDDPYYTHLHFAIALVNPKYLYPDLLEFLGRYRSS